MRWAYPIHWWWALLVPALGALFWWARRERRRALAQLAGPLTLPSLTASVDWARRWLCAGLVTVAALWLVVAAAGPQWGFAWHEVSRRGLDIIIALDVSKSMLAEDLKPSRLERAKLAIQEVLPMLGGDRVGLVAFAGTAFLQCPLTSDYDAFAMTLDEVSTDTIPRGGTALAEAVRTSLGAFEHGSTGARVIVLLTDGEGHTGDASPAAKEAAEAGVRIFAVGIGTPEGDLIPVEGHTFLKDRQGRTVKSRLDESTLQQMALRTGGSYVRSTPTSLGLDVLYRERISRLEQGEREGTKKKRYEHRYQWPLAVAWVLLLVEPLISHRRRRSA